MANQRGPLKSAANKRSQNAVPTTSSATAQSTAQRPSKGIFAHLLGAHFPVLNLFGSLGASSEHVNPDLQSQAARRQHISNPRSLSSIRNRAGEQMSTRTATPNKRSTSSIAGKPVSTRGKVVASKSDRTAKRGRSPAPDEALPATKKKKAKDTRSTRLCIVCLDDKPTADFPAVLHSDESGTVHHSGACSDC